MAVRQNSPDEVRRALQRRREKQAVQSMVAASKQPPAPSLPPEPLEMRRQKARRRVANRARTRGWREEIVEVVFSHQDLGAVCVALRWPFPDRREPENVHLRAAYWLSHLTWHAEQRIRRVKLLGTLAMAITLPLCIVALALTGEGLWALPGIVVCLGVPHAERIAVWRVRRVIQAHLVEDDVIQAHLDDDLRGEG